MTHRELAITMCVAVFAATAARSELTPGPCPPQDLLVNLNTGWDENAEAVIASGDPDDDWSVILVPPAVVGPPPPYPAGVRDPSSAWLTLPNSKWIAATAPYGPNGTYIYETCWCMDDSFTNPNLSFAIRADDQADVILNGSIVLSLPTGTFDDPTAIGISVIDPAKFHVGLNCLNVRVQQLYGGPHGFDLTGTVTADDGRCCGCVDIPPDAEAWWPFNETAGSIAFDEVNAHDGTLSGLGLPPQHFIGEHVVNSLSFNGLDDYVAVPNSPGLNFSSTDDLTIDAWIKTTSPLREPIVHKKDIPFNSPGYAFMVGGGVLTFEMSDGTTTVTCNGGSGLNDGSWHFVAATLDHSDPGGLKLYVDSSLVPVVTCNPTGVGSLLNAIDPSIGGKPGPVSGAMWWNGKLDEIEIFRRALTATQIHEIFAAGTAGKCPLPPPCAETDYPTCGGPCPPGEVCVANPNQTCGCRPVPQCGDPGDYPTCGGACPPGLVCDVVPNTQTCDCVQEPQAACGDTHYPACDGACPQDQTCVNTFGTNNCHCEPEPQPCGDALYPACNGACPANEKCVVREAPVPGCECQSCAVLGGSGLTGITLGWPSTKDSLRWRGAGECALVYNTYRATGPRLPDANRDGLADQYGACYIGDIIGNDAPDPSPPPAGQVHWYLVSGVNGQVEGSLGENRQGMERPNLAPCP